jgi:hypothetical protein
MNRVLTPSQLRQLVEHVYCLDLPVDPDLEALPAILVDDVQHAQRSPVAGPLGHKIVTPDVVPVLRTQPDAGSVVQPQAAAFGLSLRYFEPFLAPETLHPLVVHSPTVLTEQRRDPPIAVAAVLAGQSNDLVPQCVFICLDHPCASLRRPWLFQSPAHTTFGQL